MSRNQIYSPTYSSSRALIIGINEYQHVKNLGYACNDASAVAETLGKNFGFPQENISVLKDSEATGGNIRSHLMKFADRSDEDDRILIFFAGHGHTKTGKRGEVGFLIPFDGRLDDLSTLVRWDDLTRNADLFPAKHVLFVMDACYGGLAHSRFVHPGTMRFMKDMLQRYCRQVLTAGKADEVVADSGGPRLGHSVFTGHFLDALDGAAAGADGIVTANGVMAYVYDRVAKDRYSRQTPHYGFLDGDGDFIFSNLPAELLGDDSKKEDKSIIVSVSPVFTSQPEPSDAKTSVETVKEYLSDPRYRIKLDDQFSAELRSVLSQLGPDTFSMNQQPSNAGIQAEFAERLRRYEAVVEQLQGMTALLAKWAGPEHQNILQSIFARLAEVNTDHNGLLVWLGLRWYPVMLLLYSSGIAALSAERYDNLAAVLTAKVGVGHLGREIQEVIRPAVEGMLEVRRSNLFKTLPGHERHYTPDSEYLFKALQPVLEDALFLGRSYENYFDRLEVFNALVYADLNERAKEAEGSKHLWGPIGRFGWKFRNAGPNNPFSQLLLEASRQQDAWPPLRAGLFEGSYARFNDIATRFGGILGQLPWF